MIQVIIGHRGVGKTAMLDRVRHYYAQRNLSVTTLDLDAEIVAREKRTIGEIFAEQGETAFRVIESAIFQQVIREIEPLAGMKFIAVGAGFQGTIPRHVEVTWLRRITDGVGRIFPNRPRLEPGVSPLAEYLNRFEAREKRYRLMCHREITIPEGWDTINAYEPVLLGLKPANLGLAVTVLPEVVANSARLDLFVADGLRMGVKYFELRDDLLDEAAIAKVLERVPREKLLFSFRTGKIPLMFSESHASATDWAIELGPSPLLHNTFVSLHERAADESLEDALERLRSHKAEYYKFAPEVHNFMELWSGHRLSVESTNKVAFLPRSTNGRWRWYRTLRGNTMPINFMRFGDGSSADQPLAFDFLARPPKVEKFAAVLGSPIDHSRTPAEQHEFFVSRNMAVVAIEMNEEECNSLNFSILERLGLRAAAVTSPLKAKMREFCGHLDRRADELGAVNTMVWNEKAKMWVGTNTDIVGLKSALEAVDLGQGVVVWGGGGTRKVLRALLPNATFFSARKGEPIWIEEDSAEQAKEKSPETLVWAVGRGRVGNCAPPPENWRPKLVLDLNYTEDSPGIEYAMRVGAKYISGRGFFKAQARAQRDFWP